MKRKHLILTATTFCLFSCTLFSCSNQDDISQTSEDGYNLTDADLLKDGYTKIFEDNFSSDLSQWNIWNGGAYNNELQLYQSNNMTLTNGILAISAKKEKINGKTTPFDSSIKSFNFTSGRIESRFSFAPNNNTPKVRISARIKLPLGVGMWPAFWTYNDPWPTHGEIDILEALGQKYTYTTDYFYGSTPGIVQSIDDDTVKEITSPKDLTSEFHVYEVIWSKNSLIYLLDGKVVDTKISTAKGGEFIPAFYGKSEHITLNLAVGGDIFQGTAPESSIQAATMYIDWVKVSTSQ